MVSPPTNPSSRPAAPGTADAALACDGADVHRFFELSRDMMGIANADGHFVRINPAFTRTLGYSLAEFTARPFMDFVHPEDLQDTSEKFAALRAGENVVGFEDRFRCKDGTYRWLLWSASAMRGGLTYAVGRDITDRRRVEDELRIGREQAAAASRSKWEFLSLMSHELRTPLNGLMGMIQLLRDSPLDAAQTGYVDAQAASAESLLGVLSNLLYFSKLEAGGLELHASDFDLRAAVDEACHTISDEARVKGLKVSRSVDADVPLIVTGDRARVRQVLLNLLRNAVKFTPSGEVLASVTCEQANHLRFSVFDTGIGIDSEEISTLFAAADRDGPLDRQRGLGLAISRQLVELMGGRIGAERRESCGSLFWFSAELPAAQGVFTEIPATQHQGPAAECVPPDAGLLVLLAEDNEINCMVAQALLAKLGLQTAVAHDGREAIEMAAGHDYRAIFMDCMMPEVDGLQATREIRAAEGDRHVPIIAMTALAMPGDRERCIAAGMDDYLSKPVSLAALEAVVSRVLARGPSDERLVPSAVAP